MKNITIYDIWEEVKEIKTQSAWNTGVKQYALELLEDVDMEELYKVQTDIRQLKNTLLSGADNWNDYSIGGMTLIYNEDICERLCTPSEKRIRRNGAYRPNRRETWLDVQTRALSQAWNLIAATFWALQQGDINVT